MLEAIGELVKRLFLLLIAVYQQVISPLTGRCCRYSPSCSIYAAESLKKHGLGKGVWRATWRVLRCHPFSRGGFDPP